ncbi:IQ calmodulin-binding motif protein [Delitschia confertaspora ATCC 74209]|uniref:IQ calmodulin-binding motif protein n=1 Tax=Delitschia confertaspora ATCC 74209 TaxID=1513339 RepID=A0A9P4MS72_9PLEO|nr:IQ calmodulin-binding motif protein [Delitschia confertaspora ATCC 74209]
MAQIISDTAFRCCTNTRSITSELAKDPSKSPGHYAHKLFGGEHIAATAHSSHHHQEAASKEDLNRARQCGNWGDNEPSELFLQCYHDVVCSLEHDLLEGMVSPSLMGSSGVIPLSIIAPLPDICRHMSNLIARAENEVFLATNFWMASDASRLITDSLIELSRRAEKRGKKVVVKVMYDRGELKQFVDNHQIVTEKQYTAASIKLPSPHEVPFIHLEVQNYHRPVLGTFHAKFMVVDRRIAVVQSNNIQDNDNLEMMTHLEGPIVDSIYDTALLAWEKALHPPLPCLSDPASEAALPEEKGRQFRRKLSDAGNAAELLPLHAAGDPHYDPDIVSEIRRMQSVLSPRDNETRMNAVTRHLNTPTKLDFQGSAPECPRSELMTPMIAHKTHRPFPIALINRKPYGALNNQKLNVPQNAAWLSAIRNAKSSIFIQTPDLNATPLIPALEDAVRRGVEVTYYVCLGYNDAGELLPFQGGTNEMVANKLYQQLKGEERKRLHVGYYVAKDQTRPIHNKFKKRSCHIKIMIVDHHLGIQGSGNQDTQSWFHSMEVNVMIDSQEICEDWIEGLRRNQNTHLYGMASQEDGIWRDEKGNEAEGATGKDPGRFPWAKGVVGSVQRARGLGGF